MKSPQPDSSAARAVLFADILDVLHGSSPAAEEPSSSAPAEELSPGELRELRLLAARRTR